MPADRESVEVEANDIGAFPGSVPAIALVSSPFPDLDAHRAPE